jgi:hypothetical protein
LSSLKKTASIDLGPSDFHSWTFIASDRVGLVSRQKAATRFQVRLYKLTDGSLVGSAQVPGAPGELAMLASGGEYLHVYSANSPTVTAWDVTTSPTRQLTSNLPPNVVYTSADGRFRLTTPMQAYHWVLENAETRKIITRAGDHGASSRQWSAPIQPVFSPDGRYFLLHRQKNAPMLPSWVPNWVAHLYKKLGIPELTTSVVFCDPATGREVRELPGWGVVQFAPDRDRVWLSYLNWAYKSQVLEEWPIAAPPPPWWLWVVTAVGIGWFLLRCRQRRATRPGLQNPAPAVA